MPPITGTTSPGIARRVSTAVLGLMILLGGNSFNVRKDISNPSYGNRIQKFQTESGSTVNDKGYVDTTGNLVLSGSVVVGRNGTASGRLILHGTDGGKVCTADTDGSGFSVTECNNGTCSSRVATGNECTTPN